VIRSGWRNAALRRLLLVAALALLPVLAGCEAGDNAQTLNFHQPTDGTGAVAGSIAIRNVFVLGAPLGSSLTPGQSAGLFFGLVNSGAPDRLISITAPGTAVAVRLPGSGVPVQTMRPVLFTGPQPQAYLVDLTRTLASGSSLKLILHFRRQGDVALEVPVLPWAANLTTLSPAPNPSSSPAGTHPSSPTPTVTPTPTPAATATPTATPTPTPTPSRS
jgi:hypothetical protein